jgi:hypothetical protein
VSLLPIFCQTALAAACSESNQQTLEAAAAAASRVLEQWRLSRT